MNSLKQSQLYSPDYLLAILYCGFITASILLGYFFEFLVGLDGFSYIIFLLGEGVLFFYIAVSGRIKISGTFQNYILLSSLFLLFISVPFWSGFHNVSLYFSVPIAYTVYVYSFSQVKKVLLVILVLSFLVAMYEMNKQQFLFVSSIKGTNDVLDVEDGYIFRAKGLMPGVIVLGQISILLVFLFPEKWWVAILGLGCSMLACSRSGMILVSVLFLSRFKLHFSVQQIGIIIILLVILIVGVGSMIDPLTVDRLANVTNFDQSNAGVDQSNIARLYYWMAALDHFANYNLIHKIFGDNGSYFTKLSNNPESGWLSVLVDTGILGMVFYLGIFISLFTRCFIAKKWSLIFELGLLFVGMIPFTINLTREGSLLFWLTIFTLIDRSAKTTVDLEFSSNTLALNESNNSSGPELLPR